MENYAKPSGVLENDEDYLTQDIEIDAIAFAHRMMLDHFEVKTVIPDSIKDFISKKELSW